MMNDHVSHPHESPAITDIPEDLHGDCTERDDPPTAPGDQAVAAAPAVARDSEGEGGGSGGSPRPNSTNSIPTRRNPMSSDELYFEKDLTGWLGLPRATVRAARQALDIPCPQARGNRGLAYALPDAVRLVEKLGAGMTREEAVAWLRARREGLRERSATVLRSTWRNPRLVRAQLDSGEEIRVRVKDAGEFVPGMPLTVTGEAEYGTWELVPGFNLRAARRAM